MSYNILWFFEKCWVIKVLIESILYKILIYVLEFFLQNVVEIKIENEIYVSIEVRFLRKIPFDKLNQSCMVICQITC